MQAEPINLDQLRTQLAPRARNAHKGDFGHVLIIGGDYGYAGAPVLAALGALRVGAGLVTLASHKEHLFGLNAVHPEIMSVAIDDPKAMQTIASKATVIVLGPGLGRTAWSQSVYQQATAFSAPQIVDADGLFFLAQNPTMHSKRILTPHPGEALTLLQQTNPIVGEKRITAIRALCDKYACTVVLKGADTLISSPGANINVCNAGNPGMASGGMGDLLSGVIGGLVAQGLDLNIAAKLGVMLHATAGDQATRDGARGMLATDLLPFMRKLIG